MREQIAANAGFPNYLQYAFRARGRFDYTPADCRKFHDAVEKEIMPVVRQLQAERRRRSASVAPPWDLTVDPLNRPALRPFEQVEDMVAAHQNIFDQLDAKLAADFQLMRDSGCWIWTIAKARRPAATNPPWPKRACLSSS